MLRRAFARLLTKAYRVWLNICAAIVEYKILKSCAGRRELFLGARGNSGRRFSGRNHSGRNNSGRRFLGVIILGVKILGVCWV